MSDKENKLERLKNRLIKLHEKINNRVEDFQDQMQTKIEAKISKLKSNLSEDRSSNGDRDTNSDDKDPTDETSSNSTDTQTDRLSIPSVIIDEPMNVDSKQICKEFLTVERNGVLYRRCVSTSNLAIDDDCSFYSSSESCLSRLSSSDERTSEIRPRAGSLPPGSNRNIPTPNNTCSELLEKIGNRFPRLMRKGDSIHRYLLKNTRLSDVNKRLKAQIWSSVVTIVLVEAKNLPAMDVETRSSDPYC